ncbi:hypothetical protein TPAR_08179 [Tolypocladium paradoxum]|uniref:Uncharacterized protein n=1 Tax=Tolypocladium paradoxum TaxID=94208 RepID=A0A2S4KN08_9HYPO|nr:hypothetical protein TPAR_08179 [Tolypocladium paradoxum]
MVAPSATITSRRRAPCTWCSASVVVARSARRRCTPPPRRSSISARRPRWLCSSTTRWTRTATLSGCDESAPATPAVPVSSWPLCPTASIAAAAT